MLSDATTGRRRCFAIQAGATRANPLSGLDGAGVQEGLAYIIEARSEVQMIAAFAENSRAELRYEDGDGGITGSLSGGGGKAGQEMPAAQIGSVVRRLTPRECERLQGMPDDYTLTPYGRSIRPEKLDADYAKYLMRGGRMTFEQCLRAAADGPRYKAIGNSKAVTGVHWIGRRILEQIAN